MLPVVQLADGRMVIVVADALEVVNLDQLVAQLGELAAFAKPSTASLTACVD